MASFTAALTRVKDDYRHLLSATVIESLCTQAGHAWRQRVLDPVVTVHLFLLQVLHGNVAIHHLRRLSDILFSDTAYCQARARLPLEVFTGLLRWIAAEAAPGIGDAHADSGGRVVSGHGDRCAADASRWLGHRLLLEDGSAASMPDTPALQQRFGQPGGQKPGCGFPVAHLLYLFDYASGMILDVIAAPLRTHDLKHAFAMLGRAVAGDVILADRAFCSFAHLALILRAKLHAVFRVHPRVIVDFTPHRSRRWSRGRPRKRCASRRGRHAPPKGQTRSERVRALTAPRGLCDQIVRWFKPVSRPVWMSVADYVELPDTITVRELRYRIQQRGFRTRQVTLVTTLLDPQTYPALQMARLYFRRWQVEQNFRSLKQTMKMDVLRCQTVNGVMKELTMYAIAYNLVCLVMREAARRQGVPTHRVSFADALRWLARGCDEPLPALLVNPHRPGRVQPRAVKRRPKAYPRLTQPRRKMVQALMQP
jgi:hypothetical protein